MGGDEDRAEIVGSHFMGLMSLLVGIWSI